MPVLNTAASLLPVASLSLPRKALIVLAATLFIALAAQITVPMTPVPMTMQTFAVLLVGLLLGPRMAFASLMVYLGEGLAGLPVFAGGASGPAVFMGPTAGYLLAFPAAAAVAGWLSQGGGAMRVAGAVFAGLLALYIPGVLWLAFGFQLGLEKAIAVGVIPFLFGESLKAVAAAGIALGAQRLIRRQSPSRA